VVACASYPAAMAIGVGCAAGRRIGNGVEVMFVHEGDDGRATTASRNTVRASIAARQEHKASRRLSVTAPLVLWPLRR
jgi:hypothetical protein